MRVGYVSDLHLEFRDFPHVTDWKDVGGDLLILAGDIVPAQLMRPERTDSDSRKLKKFLSLMQQQVFSKYGKVIAIAGNHEHYQYFMDLTHLTLMYQWKEYGVQYLNNDIVIANGVPVIASTLWSDFEKNDPMSKLLCHRYMNDYRIIGKPYAHENPAYMYAADCPINPDDTLNQHDIAVKYIMHQAELFDPADCIVVTHHAPVLSSLNQQHVGNGADGAYASDLSWLIENRPNIKYWIHGHTHMNVDTTVYQCRVLSNQRGYSHEVSYANFEGISHFEL